MNRREWLFQSLALLGGTMTRLAGGRTKPTVSIPTSFAVYAKTDTTITVTWAGLTRKYSLYVDGVFVTTVQALTYTFTGLTCEQAYLLSVVSVGTNGQRSAPALLTVTTAACPPVLGGGDGPPPSEGYFPMGDLVLAGGGRYLSLPDSAAAALLVTGSTWEPRPLNTKRNNVLVAPGVVAAGFAARPLAVDNNYNALWDSWLLPRVDGQFQGTTDEIFQWAAFKWGLPDNLLRAIAVRESTWHQYLVYPSQRPVVNWGCGDLFPDAVAANSVFLNYVAGFGHDYQADFGAGHGPKTYSIIGCMSWQAPSWGQMPDNQNGTFPHARDSTAFAVDYLAGHIRGVYEGWEQWLVSGGSGYAAGDLWGAVGSWYSGDWHSAAADGYITRVQAEIANLTWLQSDWPSIIHSCDPTYGCPEADSIALQAGETT